MLNFLKFLLLKGRHPFSFFVECSVLHSIHKQASRIPIVWFLKRSFTCEKYASHLFCWRVSVTWTIVRPFWEKPLRIRLAAVSSLLWCFHLIVVKSRKVLFCRKVLFYQRCDSEHCCESACESIRTYVNVNPSVNL
jgi:hypothetical protein